MNMAIDAGNMLTKVGIFEGGLIKPKQVFASLAKERIFLGGLQSSALISVLVQRQVRMPPHWFMPGDALLTLVPYIIYLFVGREGEYPLRIYISGCNAAVSGHAPQRGLIAGGRGEGRSAANWRHRGCGASRAGVMHGILEEINGIAARYKQDHPGVRVILTGGDAHFFEKKVNPSIFVAPDLVLMGLNSILMHGNP